MSAAIVQHPPAFLRSETRPLAVWIFCWIILPNAGFWLLWVVGSPPRYLEILVIGLIGLLVRDRPYGVKLAVFLIAAAFSTVSFVAGMFNLAVTSVLASLQFAAELQPGASIEYALCLAGVLATFGLAGRALRWPSGFAGTGALSIAVAAIFGVAALDYGMSGGTRPSYSRGAAQDAVFESGVADSGFGTGAPAGRDLVLVMVESMGLPNDPVMRARLTTRWRQPDIAARYTMTQGSTAYFGSTMGGEMRELCGRWGDYADLLDTEQAHCLPAQLAARGYRTTAIHGFERGFFARARWYRRVGFDHMVFRQALLAEGAAKCPGVFPGACDRDVPPVIAAELAESAGPQFIYWLTLNSHLPVLADAALRTTRCPPGEHPAIRRFGMICRQFKLWDDIAESLAAQLLKPGFRDADILLVGDHMPPYFDRRQRAQFDPARVPWILLRRKTRDARSSALARR